MKDMTWDDFYSKFYDLAPSTQRSYSYRLSNFGPADEVYEIISEFAMEDEAFATRFASKALDAGVRFTPDHVMEMPILLEEPIVSRMAATATGKFTKDQLEEIYSLIDDSSFELIRKKAGVNVFEDDIDEWDSTPGSGLDDCYFDQRDDEAAQRRESIGAIFGILGGIIVAVFGFVFALIGALMGLSDSSKARDNGRCNGDCANCPAHYGYRYGRWYYGHGHQHGCQRGGNGGASGRTYRD